MATKEQTVVLEKGKGATVALTHGEITLILMGLSRLAQRVPKTAGERRGNAAIQKLHRQFFEIVKA